VYRFGRSYLTTLDWLGSWDGLEVLFCKEINLDHNFHMNQQPRYKHLDGLRGVAILFVIFFHAYSRWPDLTSFGSHLYDFLPFKYGWLGVQLFFLISGFVILMTLERTSGFLQFMRRRWLRLFPALLICSALVFLTAPLLPERPLGVPFWGDVIPGLLLVDPDTIRAATGLSIGMLEGSFWSLFVEFKFYIVFGLIYFMMGEKAAMAGIFAIFSAWALCRVGLKMRPDSVTLQHAKAVFDVVGANYYAWFAAGAMYFKQVKTGRMAWGVGAFFMSLMAAFSFGQVLEPKIAGFVVCAIFALSMWSKAVQYVLQVRPLLFVGFISYPLYLLHENALVALTVKLGRWAPSIPATMLPVVPVLFLMAIAWIVAKKLEPSLRRVICALMQWGRLPSPVNRSKVI